MSGDGLLSLRWNNHRASFLHILSVLRTKDSYSDVTLACEGHFYAVHKFVLSTCSDYFVEMIEKTPCKHPVIVLKDIQKCDLEALLNYMYLGEVNVLQNDLARLIKAAECLRIKGLAVPDEAPSPAPPPTPGGGEGGGGGGSGGGGGGGSGGGAYANYADGRSNKPRRRRYESENDETSSSPIRKRPAMGDTNREKASPERRQSRDSSGAPSREPTDSNTTGDTSAGRKEVNVDLSNVKMEAEELKDEYEPNYVEIEDSSDADTNMGTGGEGNSNTTTQPPRSSSANSRIKVEQTSPRSSSQDFQPQSIEEIVSQALPGASIVTGDGSGGPWDGGGSEGDSYQSFPFSQQQDSGGAMHQGPQHSGRSWDSRSLSKLESASTDAPLQWDLSTNSSVNAGATMPQRNSSVNAEILPHVKNASNIFYSHLSIHENKNNPERLMCHICGYKAYTPSILQIHIRKHTGEKPFKCPQCNYGSAQSSNLNRHIKAHHAPTDSDIRPPLPKAIPYIMPNNLQGMTQSPTVTPKKIPLLISHARTMMLNTICDTQLDLQHTSSTTRVENSQVVWQERTRTEAQANSLEDQTRDSLEEQTTEYKTQVHETVQEEEEECIKSSSLNRNTDNKYIDL